MSEGLGQRVTEIVWNADWSHTREHWPEMFADLDLVGEPNLSFLEIGCFEGQSALWTLENVLTHPSSRLTIIDPLEFRDINDEDQRVRLARHLAPHFSGRFDGRWGGGRVRIFDGRSEDVLRRDWYRVERFDFVYVDGDHYPAGVLKDAVLAWPLVKPGGAMLFDDYVHELGGHRGPRPAIDAFVDCYADTEEIARHELVGADQYLVLKASS